MLFENNALRVSPSLMPRLISLRHAAVCNPVVLKAATRVDIFESGAAVVAQRAGGGPGSLRYLL